MLFGRAAQTLNEYAIVIAIITLAIMGINTYLKRGIQNVIVSTADDLASPAVDLYKIHSQVLGSMESGLVGYSSNTNTRADKETSLVEVPPSGSDPVRTYTTVKDNSISSGAWSTIYQMGGTESFGGKEKAKKPPSGNNNMLGGK